MSSTSQTQEDKIAEIIAGYCFNSEVSVVSGSTLGSLLKEHFPNLNFKEEYQGLAAFITKYCSEQIESVGKRGADNLFMHKSREGEAHGVRPRSLRPWVTFSDPRLDNKLFVNPESGELKVVASGTPPPSNRFLEIDRLNESDYRKIAEEFLEKEVPSEKNDIKDSLKHVIEHSDFWFEFVNNVQNYGSSRKCVHGSR